MCNSVAQQIGYAFLAQDFLWYCEGINDTVRKGIIFNGLKML